MLHPATADARDRERWRVLLLWALSGLVVVGVGIGFLDALGRYHAPRPDAAPTIAALCVEGGLCLLAGPPVRVTPISAGGRP